MLPGEKKLVTVHHGSGCNLVGDSLRNSQLKSVQERPEADSPEARRQWRRRTSWVLLRHERERSNINMKVGPLSNRDPNALAMSAFARRLPYHPLDKSDI
jgi:hypothetical protein